LRRSTVSFDVVFAGDKNGKLADYTGVRELQARFNNSDEAFNEFRQYVVRQMSGLRLPRGVSEVRIVLKFVVDRDGSLTDIEVLQSGNDNFARHADHVLRHSPRWQPAIRDGMAVRMSFILPITFRTTLPVTPSTVRY
jgi:protein TonB